MISSKDLAWGMVVVGGILLFTIPPLAFVFWALCLVMIVVDTVQQFRSRIRKDEIEKRTVRRLRERDSWKNDSWGGWS